VLIVIRDGIDIAISSCLFGNAAMCGVESREWGGLCHMKGVEGKGNSFFSNQPGRWSVDRKN
jgi:hypothetical protein